MRLMVGDLELNWPRVAIVLANLLFSLQMPLYCGAGWSYTGV